jgi:hypothetical protein
MQRPVIDAPFRRRLLSGAAAACVLVGASSAMAQPAERDDEADYQPTYERRSDFFAGATLGLGVMSARGYPNEAGKLNNPDFVADPGLGAGSHYAVWLGVAFRDWLSFGMGFNGLGYKARDLEAGGGGFIVRVEAFPMFYAFEQGRDIGLYGVFGLGSMTIKDGDSDKADGGALSIVGFGAFYEPLRFGIFSAGPSVEYTRMYSQSLELQSASVGFRLALYTGP